MVATLPSSSSKHHFSISSIISKFRVRKTTGNDKNGAQSVQDAPLEARPPLKPGMLPLVLPEHQQTLSRLGWTTVTFPNCLSAQSSPDLNEPHAPEPGSHPLQTAYEQLFAASQAFFTNLGLKRAGPRSQEKRNSSL